MRETQHILKSVDVSNREHQKEKYKQQQAKEMEARWVEKTGTSWAPVDMAQALAQVRTSSVGIPQSLSRFNGTTLYNPPIPKR